MLARFDQPQDPLVAERTAKACLLLVLPEPELAAAGKLADMAIKAATDDHWVQFTVELKEYRLARFASAVEWAQKALADPGEKPKRDVGAYAVLAMAYHQLGCLEDARLALANANETVRMKLPNVQDGNPGADFQDWFIAQILLREAQMLINGSLEKPG
jgi:Flp pilus assembly protein TadD